MNLPPKPKTDEPRINGQINNANVRLIDSKGGMIGVVASREAQRLADQAGLDLVEISPNAEPPVCKIMDYGKYKYEAQKKAAEQRKKQKVIVVKEIKLRPTIDKHDLDVKLRAVNGFIEDGDKVKFTLKFRGREIAHQEFGMRVLETIRTELGDTVKIEIPPRMEGRQMVMMIAPK
jgi:translation initiation factor IF-3